MKTDNEQAFQRVGAAGQWAGPVTFGAQRQAFFGFNINENFELIVETGEGHFNVDDYQAWTTCGGACSFVLDNGELKMIS